MIDFYWGCFAAGILFAVISLIFGDILGDILDGIFDAISFDQVDFIHPMVIVGGITVFGGSGILLSQYTRLEPSMTVWLSLFNALVISVIVYFAYVKPMKNSENSTGFSVQDLVGKTRRSGNNRSGQRMRRNPHTHWCRQHESDRGQSGRRRAFNGNQSGSRRG